MFTFLKIAIRNIIRNKKRSLITISAVGFGLGALIFVWSFAEGAHRQMIDNYTSILISHVQIHKNGFHQNQKLETNFMPSEKLINNLNANEKVKNFSKRIIAVGLASSAESSAGVMIIGIEPEDEKKISSLNKRIVKGQYINSEGRKDIVIGKALADNLRLELNDKIILMSQALDGSIASGAYRIKGLFDTGNDVVDKGIALITREAADELFVMDGKISEIAVKLYDSNLSKQAVEELSNSINLTDIEILPWQKVDPSLQQWIDFDNTFIFVLEIIIMIVVAIGILNTVLMGVLERTREFGILLAIGTKRSEIVKMVVWESFLLGLIGSIAGIIIGVFLTEFFSRIGINLTIFSRALSSFYMDPIIYPKLHLGFTVISSIMVLIISSIVSLYPSWHASNLKPVEAIRSI